MVGIRRKDKVQSERQGREHSDRSLGYAEKLSETRQTPGLTWICQVRCFLIFLSFIHFLGSPYSLILGLSEALGQPKCYARASRQGHGSLPECAKQLNPHQHEGYSMSSLLAA